jgi:hypothetical protein
MKHDFGQAEKGNAVKVTVAIHKTCTASVIFDVFVYVKQLSYG